MKEAYDLRKLTGELTKAFPEIAALYLFGSRRYRTGSLRSDVDILVELRDASHVRPQELRAFSTEHCRALDLFVAEGGSVASEVLPPARITYSDIRRVTLATSPDGF